MPWGYLRFLLPSSTWIKVQREVTKEVIKEWNFNSTSTKPIYSPWFLFSFTSFVFARQKTVKAAKLQGKSKLIFWEFWSWFLLKWNKIQVTWLFFWEISSWFLRSSKKWESSTSWEIRSRFLKKKSCDLNFVPLQEKSGPQFSEKPVQVPLNFRPFFLWK